MAGIASNLKIINLLYTLRSECIYLLNLVSFCFFTL